MRSNQSCRSRASSSREIELHFVLRRPILKSECLHAHVGDFQIQLERSFEAIQLVHQSEDFVGVLYRHFEVDRIFVVGRFFVYGLAGLLQLHGHEGGDTAREGLYLENFRVGFAGETNRGNDEEEGGGDGAPTVRRT